MEKTVTFTVTDALISPLGLAMLTGAGIAEASDSKLVHLHAQIDTTLDSDGEGSISLTEIQNELGLSGNDILVCKETNFEPFAVVLDNNGGIEDWVTELDISGTTSTTTGTVKVDSSNPLTLETASTYAGKTIKIDFYVVVKSGATEITIAPEDFGGTFYVEADTLYRNQDGKDMAATLTFPKVKIQSAFTLSMNASGDPSTFDFTMDAMPGYTFFDKTKKVVCDITIINGETGTEDSTGHVEHTTTP